MFRSPIWSLTLLVTELGLATSSALAKPRVLVDINQITPQEAANSSRLRCDGVFILADNSPQLIHTQLWQICHNIGTGIAVSEDGAISKRHLLDGVMTSRFRLVTPTGDLVTAVANQPLRAIPANGSIGEQQTIRWYPTPPPSGMAIDPNLHDMPVSGVENALRSNSGNWIRAEGGGGGVLTSSSQQQGVWEIFRLHKLTGGDNLIRLGDTVAVQAWNGLFTGGSIVGVDGTGLLVADRPFVTDPAAPFRVTYPCEFAVASQVIGLTYAFAYTEFSEAFPPGSPLPARLYTLETDTIDEIRARTGKPVLVLGRSFVNLSHFPGVLPTLRQQIITALDNPNCAGVVFERVAGAELTSEELYAGIDAVCRRGKKCFMLFPPEVGSRNYRADIERSVGFLRQSPWYDSLNIVLACYDRSQTQVNFLRGKNSVEGALKWVMANR